MVDTVVIQTAGEDKEDPKHIEEMVAKVDAAAAATSSTDTPEVTTPATKPDWVPEKFWDAEKGVVRTEELAKSYGELEAKQGKPATEAPAKAATEEDPKKVTTEEDPAAAELASKGLDLEDFNKEFQTSGTLSDESYAKLDKAGYPRQYVDSYIAGQQALADKFATEVKSIAGGAEGFAAMAQWAAVNATPEELAAYNRAVESNDTAAAKLAVAGLFQQYQQANPTEPNLITAKGGKVGADAYESRQQLQTDMSNPLYKTDPAFRKKVIEKLSRSDIL